MLRKTAEIAKPSKKRVHWDSSVQNNEGKTRAKRQKTVHFSQRGTNLCQESIKKIINSLKPHLFKSSSPQLKEMLDRYSSDEKISILSTGDLFNAAALASNIEALRFIIETVSQNVAYNMLHNKNVFESFLCHEYTLEKHAKSDSQKRREGFKIFLKIDHETIRKAFNTFDSKWHHTTYQLSLRNDFSTALIQLKEEGVIYSDELSTTEEYSSDSEQEFSKNDLLNHLKAHNGVNTDKNLTFYGTTDHIAFNSMATEEDADMNSKDISNLTEIAKKVQTSPISQTQAEKHFSRELL
jgi:hypothetical protein